MVTEHPRSRTMTMTVLKRAVTEPVSYDFGVGARITHLTAVRREPIGNYQPGDRFLSEEIRDWYDTADSQFFRKELMEIRPRGEQFVVIDASELGDAVVLSGAKHTVGRELQSEEMTDTGEFPPMDEDGTQSFVYIFCQTTAPAPAGADEVFKRVIRIERPSRDDVRVLGIQKKKTVVGCLPNLQDRRPTDHGVDEFVVRLDAFWRHTACRRRCKGW